RHRHRLCRGCRASGIDVPRLDRGRGVRGGRPGTGRPRPHRGLRPVHSARIGLVREPRPVQGRRGRAAYPRRRHGARRAHHRQSARLGARVCKAVVERSGVAPNAVEDVIFGCIDQLGMQPGDIARTAWLVAGFSVDSPGVTIDRQCGSSQQAIHFAAQGVMSGTQDIVIAGGVQNMSTIPIGSAGRAGKQMGFPSAFHDSPGWVKRYGTEPVSQFHGAELIAEKWNISREDMEVFALESHRRARQAQTEGRFEREIVPLGDFKVDEGPRDTSVEKMAALPVLEGAKYLTAAVSSPANDAACASLIASEKAVKARGHKPRARIHHVSVRGADPIYMLTGPINATEYALKKTGMSLDDID